MMGSAIAHEGNRRFEEIHGGKEALVRAKEGHGFMQSWDRGEEFFAVICEEGAEVENVFSHHSWVGGSQVATFTVTVSVGDDEAIGAVYTECMHGMQLGKLTKDFGWPFELMECFAGFGVGRLVGAHDKTTNQANDGHGKGWVYKNEFP